MSQDLVLTTPVKDEPESLIQIVQLPIIKERLRILKDFVDQQVADAMAMVCTPDTVVEVKQIRAELNAVFTEAETQRKAVKSAVMQPYLDFEEVYKECIAEPYRRADADLRSKVNAVESELKQACETRLREFFDECIQANGLDFLKFEQTGISVSMADAKAKTQPPKKLREQLERFVSQVGQDVDMIRTLENAAEVMAVYTQTLNVTDAIQTVNERHRQIEQAEAEQERRNEVKTQEAEAMRKVEAFAPPVADNLSSTQDEQLTVTFSVTDTRDRLKLLKHFLEANGYKYEN